MKPCNHAAMLLSLVMAYSCGGGGTSGTAPEPDASVVDNPPTVKIISPLPDLNLSRVINITARADDDFGVDYVEFFIDDASLGKVMADPYVLAWDASQSSVGPHIVRVEAVDTAGQSAEDEVTINVSCSYTNEQVEACDGLDNDCDGILDNNCDCLDGETRQCGDSDIGECRFGTETCADGRWGECLGTVLAVPETCDGLDNDCDGIPDNDCDCLDGETRPCGDTDVGECEFGIETCADGKWGGCLGAILPQPEICDGADNDCDGELDEQPEADAFCDNGLFCDGAELCDNGACRSGVAPDCSSLADQCNSGVCNETADACEAQPANEGLSCDDSLFCNEGETCQSGSCTGGAARNCDDGLYCTGSESCNETTNSCVSAGDPCPGTECNTCNETADNCFDPAATPCGNSSSSQCDQPDTCDGAGSCQPNYVSAATACDDGFYCNTGETCDGSGSCAGGSSRDCSAYTDQCNSGACNETADACEAQPTNEGLVCDDGAFCNVGETCQSGACTGGAPRDCDDGLFCTGAETCDELADSCVSAGDPCSGTECNTCDETVDNCFDPAATPCGDLSSDQCDSPDTCDGLGACQPNYVSAATACDDGFYCNTGETCDGSGSCAGGSSRDCSAFTDQCNSGACNETADACEAQPANEGLSCDDSLFCNVGETCQSGSCTSGVPRDCDDGLYCTGTETCNELADSCVSAGDPCPGTECQTCQEDSDSCLDPAATPCGDPSSSQCDQPDTCDGLGACAPNYVSAVTPCDDGLFCNVGETCDGVGSCASGNAKDCSAYADQCNAGLCDEIGGSCYASPKTLGITCGDPSSSQCDQPDTCDGLGACAPNYVSAVTPCDDGLFCNVGETCDGVGSCASGNAKDCSTYADQCNSGLCDELLNICYSSPINEMGVCDDGSVCTSTTVCQNGNCVGSADKDNDGDGYIDEVCGGDDCDDAKDTIFPGGFGICDGFDNDCNKQIDETAVVNADVRITNDSNESEALKNVVWTGTEFGVVWADNRNEPNPNGCSFRDCNYEIYFTRFNLDGSKIGTDIRITTNTKNSTWPSLVWTGTEYGVAWQDVSIDGWWFIYFVRLNPSGTKIGSEIKISNSGDAIGAFLVWTGTEYGVAWEGWSSGNAEIYFSRISSDGVELGSDTRITNNSAYSGYPSLVWTGTEYGVAWFDTRASSSNPEIYFARISETGSKIGSDIRITNYSGNSYDPRLVWADIEYGVSWHDNRFVSGSDNYNIYFARISSAGIKIGSDVRITDYSEFSVFSSLAFIGGEYGVAWRAGNGYQIKFARLSSNGIKIGTDTVITQASSWWVDYPFLAPVSNTEYGLCWVDKRDGNKEIYFARINTCR